MNDVEANELRKVYHFTWAFLDALRDPHHYSEEEFWRRRLRLVDQLKRCQELRISMGHD